MKMFDGSLGFGFTPAEEAAIKAEAGGDSVYEAQIRAAGGVSAFQYKLYNALMATIVKDPLGTMSSMLATIGADPSLAAKLISDPQQGLWKLSAAQRKALAGAVGVGGDAKTSTGKLNPLVIAGGAGLLALLLL